MAGLSEASVTQFVDMGFERNKVVSNDDPLPLAGLYRSLSVKSPSWMPWAIDSGQLGRGPLYAFARGHRLQGMPFLAATSSAPQLSADALRSAF